MDGCETIGIRELFKSMLNFVPPLNVCNKKNGKEIRLDNLFTTSMLLDSLKIKTIYTPFHSDYLIL